MEEQNVSQTNGQETKRSCQGSAAPFFVGLVAALIVGWWIFPKVLFSEQAQPIRFSHIVHMEDAGMACADCHYFREDGTYNGLPTVEDCAGCHSDVMGENPEEAKFVEEYVNEEKEIQWLVYQYQPDNVFFSHAVHSMATCVDMGCHTEMFSEGTERELCNVCHPDLSANDTPPAVYKNRLTDYTKQTMKMWQCEECHALPEHYSLGDDGMTRANNACFTCHK